jgi:hypothetical protein
VRREGEAWRPFHQSGLDTGEEGQKGEALARTEKRRVGNGVQKGRKTKKRKRNELRGREGQWIMRTANKSGDDVIVFMNYGRLEERRTQAET